MKFKVHMIENHRVIVKYGAIYISVFVAHHKGKTDYHVHHPSLEGYSREEGISKYAGVTIIDVDKRKEFEDVVLAAYYKYHNIQKEV